MTISTLLEGFEEEGAARSSTRLRNADTCDLCGVFFNACTCDACDERWLKTQCINASHICIGSRAATRQILKIRPARVTLKQLVLRSQTRHHRRSCADSRRHWYLEVVTRESRDLRVVAFLIERR